MVATVNGEYVCRWTAPSMTEKEILAFLKGFYWAFPPGERGWWDEMIAGAHRTLKECLGIEISLKECESLMRESHWPKLGR